MPLSVRSSETNKDFVSRSFAFYDCSIHDSCRKCVKSNWNCNWCIYDNKCVVQNSTCRNTGNTVISTENVSTISPFKSNSINCMIINIFSFYVAMSTHKAAEKSNFIAQ